MVGKGECWDLADQALRSAGANSSTTTGADDNYVWGNAVSLTQVLAGDVLQFRDYTVSTTTTTTTTFDDGSETETTLTEDSEREHHTAIVSRIISAGALEILEQNAKPAGKKVQRQVLPIQNMTSTKVERKTMKDAAGKLRMAKVETKVDIVVSGRLWVYRPKAK